MAEEITTDYNWADKITKVTRKHTDFTNIQHTLIDRYTYDHGLRAKDHFHKFDNLAERRTSKKNYTFKDELAELNLGYSSNPLVFDPLQSIDYVYNNRGFLMGINKNENDKISSNNQYYYQCSNNYTPTAPIPLHTSGESNSPDVFMEQLYYNEKDNGYLGSSKQYNGNIQAIAYQVFGVDRQAFGYAYDDLNRMYRAQYGAIDNSNNLTFNSRYNETLDYDPRGNISSLRRNGTSGTCIISNPNDPNQQLPVYSFAPIDNLVYKYNGIHKNRLEKITESALSDYGFKIKSGVDQNTAQYEYDKNGNLIKDPYKKITNIAYNHLNLPISITFDDVNTKSILTFKYDASGQKWQKQKQVYRKNNPLLGPLQDETYYYCNGIEYRAGSQKPDIIQTEEGRLVWTTGTTEGSGSYKYEYAIRDHLGNTRVMVSDKNGNNKIDPNTEITQVNHYYAFGMNQDGPWLAGNKGDNKYQYNGKEFNDDFGLDLVDYSKRWYDPSIARFISVDGLAENFPHNGMYNYAENRPVNGVDLDGLEWVYYQNAGINHIDVNVAFSYVGQTLSQKEFANYKNVIAAEYTRILETSSGGSYTGAISFNSENQYSNTSIIPNTIADDYGSLSANGTYIAGQSVNGGFIASVMDAKRNVQSAESFALDYIHELMHTSRMGHPFEITNTIDCELTKCNGSNYDLNTTSNTDASIFDNLMMYNVNTINGQSLKTRWGVKEGDRLTPGQLNFLKNEAQIQMKGKPKNNQESDNFWLDERGSELLNGNN